MEERPGIWKVGFMYGLFVGLAMAVYSILLLMTNNDTNAWLNLLSYVILLGGIVWAHQSYKNTGDTYMSYGEGLSLGAAVSVIAGAITGIFSIVYNRYIDPEMLQRTMNQQIVAMQDRGASQSDIDMVQKVAEIIQMPVVTFIAAIVNMLFWGFLMSLIISAITRKNNPELYN